MDKPGGAEPAEYREKYFCLLLTGEDSATALEQLQLLHPPKELRKGTHTPGELHTGNKHFWGVKKPTRISAGITCLLQASLHLLLSLDYRLKPIPDFWRAAVRCGDLLSARFIFPHVNQGNSYFMVPHHCFKSARRSWQNWPESCLWTKKLSFLLIKLNCMFRHL